MFEKKYSGFTLIELMLSISLMALLFGIGLASYLDFNRRQLVFSSARRIVQDLRLAQSLAINNQKPLSSSPPCEILNSYIFEINHLEKTYEIKADCTSGQIPFKTGSIPQNLLLSGFNQVKFKVLRQGIECSVPDPCNLTVSDYLNSKTVFVGAGGVIKIAGE